MKKILALSAVIMLTLALTSCADTTPQNPQESLDAPNVVGTQEPEPDAAGDPEQTEQTEPAVAALDDMPAPYELGGDTCYVPTNFRDICRMPFEDAFSFDGDICTSEEFEEWCDSLRDSMSPLLTERINCYSAMLRFGLTDEQARDFYVTKMMILTDPALNEMLAHDEAALLKRFARAETIVIGDRGYTPEWLYYHTISDWTAAGITAENVEGKLELYAELSLVDEAKNAFAKKLSEFLGHDVSFEAQNKTAQPWNDAPASDPDIAPDPDSIVNMPPPFDASQTAEDTDKFYFDENYAIAVGEELFFPDWLYWSKLENWRNGGITPEAVEEKVQLYFNMPLTMEAMDAFMDKISEFLGHEIIADGNIPDQPRLKNGNIEYDLGLLCEWSAQDFEREGITAEMIEEFLKEIYDGYHGSSQYEYLESMIGQLRA